MSRQRGGAVRVACFESRGCLGAFLTIDYLFEVETDPVPPSGLEAFLNKWPRSLPASLAMP